MHIAALPGRLGQNLTDRRLQPLMIVGDDKLDTGQPTPLEPREEVAIARAAGFRMLVMSRIRHAAIVP
jgi:hypothetical protein